MATRLLKRSHYNGRPTSVKQQYQLQYSAQRPYDVGRMVSIQFQDRPAETRALAFLLGRFSGRVLRGGVHLVPEAALEALASQNIPFTVIGKATYAQQVAAIRAASPAPVQRRHRRSTRMAR
jgi:hypothetical protein